jgi:hypothetical protein
MESGCSGTMQIILPDRCLSPGAGNENPAACCRKPNQPVLKPPLFLPYTRKYEGQLSTFRDSIKIGWHSMAIKLLIAFFQSCKLGEIILFRFLKVPNKIL